MTEREQPPDITKRSEQERLNHLRTDQGINGLDFAMAIEDERDIDDQEINAEISWVRFEAPQEAGMEDLAAIEGKLYLPNDNKGKNELILFTPGFPGGNAGRFETRYAKAFTDAGFAFFTIRHNATSLTNGEVSAGILNSKKRMDLAAELGEKHIGGTKKEGYSPVDIVNETVTPLMHLASKFDKVHLMGQSMGVAASYNAVSRTKEHPEVQGKVDKVVGISGYVGKSAGESHEEWDGIKGPMEELTKYEYEYVAKVGANMVPEERFEEEMAKVAQLNSEVEVPEQMGNVLIFTPEDPIVKGLEKLEGDARSKAVAEYGPKSKHKVIIRDESSLGEPKPHSMLWIKPENLLRAVNNEVKGISPHYFKVPNTKGGMAEAG